MIAALLRFLRFVWIVRRRRPRFVVGLLAIGIGATTAMFSIVSAFYLSPLPYPRPEELGVVWALRAKGEQWSMALPVALDVNARAQRLAGLSAFVQRQFTAKLDDGPPEVVMGGATTGNFFDVFEMKPLLGRVYHAADDRVDGPKIVVVGERFWRRRLAADPNVVGRVLVLDGQSYTVVGVAAPRFGYGGAGNGATSLWAPLAVSDVEYQRSLDHRGDHSFATVARMRTGVSRAEAQAELDAIMRDLGQAHPNTDEGFGLRLEDLHEEMVGSSRHDLQVLFGAVGLLLAVVCANVANLLLARSSSRRAEMATRLALGATRGRIIAQVIGETLITFVLGAAGGLVIASFLVGPLVRGVSHNYAWENLWVPIDARSYVFAVGAALIAGMLAGLAPALEVSRLPPRAVLEASSGRATRRRSRLRQVLVVLQVALALALLLDSARVTRDYAALAFRDPGFDAGGVAAALYVVPLQTYSENAEQQEKLVRDSLAKIRAFPGVESVALASGFPMSHHDSAGGYTVEGRPHATTLSRAEMLNRRIVTAGYFETLRIPIRRGRSFSAADEAPGAPRVMVLSEGAARMLFPNGEDPIGKRVDWMDHDQSDDAHVWREVIGVAGDVRDRGLGEEAQPMSYVLTSQHVWYWIAVLARTSRGADLLAAYPRLVADADPSVGVSGREMLTETVSGSIGATRFTAILLIAFSLSALVLAALGVFGLVSYTTSLRTKEIGLRVALGATPGNVLRLVMREGARLVGLGLVLGVIAHVAYRRTLDVRLAALTFGVLAAAGLVACLLPALRAARMNPSTALKTE